MPNKKLIFIDVNDIEVARAAKAKYVDMHPGNNPNYDTIYAFECKFNNIIGHFPGYDFSNLINNSNRPRPIGSVGIRIYHGVEKGGTHGHKFMNFAVFTKPSATSGEPDDDILEKAYLLTNHFFDLREFAHDKLILYPLSNHSTCEPRCPKIGL